MKWVIFGRKEEGETGLTTREGYEAQPQLQRTVDGTPCRVYDEFDAETYEEAKARYDEHMGFGPVSGEG
jgi:hypothetical protein